MVVVINVRRLVGSDLFFFIVTATTEIYTLSLHDALPIWLILSQPLSIAWRYQTDQTTDFTPAADEQTVFFPDRKSTRLNSSHTVISYAVFCLKKKNYIAETHQHGNAFPHRASKAGSRRRA